MTLSAKPSYIVYFLFGNSLSVCVGYSDLVLLTKYLWEIKSMETRGFNTTIAACVFDLVSIQNSFVAFLELNIVKCKIIYIMSPVCRPCWNLIWYQVLSSEVPQGPILDSALFLLQQPSLKIEMACLLTKGQNT